MSVRVVVRQYKYIAVGDKVEKDHILAPVLKVLYQSLFSSGSYVREWSAASLSAVFKKGDASCLDNYRAIAVSSVLGKLYAVLLDARLSHRYVRRGMGGARDKQGSEQAKAPWSIMSLCYVT